MLTIDTVECHKKTPFLCCIYISRSKKRCARAVPTPSGPWATVAALLSSGPPVAPRFAVVPLPSVAGRCPAVSSLWASRLRPASVHWDPVRPQRILASAGGLCCGSEWISPYPGLGSACWDYRALYGPGPPGHLTALL